MIFDNPEAAAWAAARVDSTIAVLVATIANGAERRRKMRPIRQVQRALYHYARADQLEALGKSRRAERHRVLARRPAARACAAVPFVLDGRAIDPRELFNAGMQDLVNNGQFERREAKR